MCMLGKVTTVSERKGTRTDGKTRERKHKARNKRIISESKHSEMKGKDAPQPPAGVVTCEAWVAVPPSVAAAGSSPPRPPGPRECRQRCPTADPRRPAPDTKDTPVRHLIYSPSSLLSSIIIEKSSFHHTIKVKE